MMHGAIAFQSADGLDVDGTVTANPAEIVAHEIDNHDVLRTILWAGEQLGNPGLILGGRRAARPGPFDRSRLDFTRAHVEEPFRRSAGDSEIAKVEIARERRRVALAQAA